MDSASLSNAIYRLDAWFQSMRNSDGYCGPITHWWQSVFLYCGPMVDWRYEGLICGYLQLYRTTSQRCWLDRALTAGEDLLRAQLPDGQFWNSGFQGGPLRGGTPHEAAVDVALLELAKVLRSQSDPHWKKFFDAAENNLLKYHVGCLWNGLAFRDQTWNQTLVPNKNATTMEACLLYQELSGRSMELYILGAVNLIRSAQVSEPGPRQGATIHLGTGDHRLAIGIYTARCLAALVRLYQYSPQTEYLDRACQMLKFLLKSIVENGTLFGFYPDGRPIACPTWISASGDLLRAMITLAPYASVPPSAIEMLADILIENQLLSGGIPTARGLGYKGQTHAPASRPDFRDVVPVAGWCDKAFRGLSMLVRDLGVAPDQNVVYETAVECEWKGRDCVFSEDAQVIQLTDQQRRQRLFDWKKGEWYPRVYKL